MKSKGHFCQFTGHART